MRLGACDEGLLAAWMQEAHKVGFQEVGIKGHKGVIAQLCMGIGEAVTEIERKSALGFRGDAHDIEIKVKRRYGELREKRSNLAWRQGIVARERHRCFGDIDS